MVVVVVLLFLLSLYAGYSLWQLKSLYPEPITFDAALWQTSSTGGRDAARCLMQQDLEQNHLSIGMTKREVTQLLGAGEITEQGLSYDLGFCNPFGIDPYALGLEFEQDKLSRIYDIQY
jgi:hypothetical protein